MARRSKQPKPRPDPEEAATRDDVSGFFREYAQKDRDKGLANKRLGEFKVAFSDRTGLNKTAISFMARMNRLSPEKRDDVFLSIDVMRERLAGDWNQQPQMDFGGDTRDPAERLKQGRDSARRDAATSTQTLGEAAAAVANKVQQMADKESGIPDAEEVETPPAKLDPPKEPIAKAVSNIAERRKARGGKLGLALVQADDPGVQEANEEIKGAFNEIVE